MPDALDAPKKLAYLQPLITVATWYLYQVQVQVVAKRPAFAYQYKYQVPSFQSYRYFVIICPLWEMACSTEILRTHFPLTQSYLFFKEHLTYQKKLYRLRIIMPIAT